MKISSKITIGFVIITLAISVLAYVTLTDLNKLVQPISHDLPQNIDALKKQSQLDGKAQFIRYYDEVLTQSARNYAFTGNKEWEERYRNVEPQLDMIIKEAIREGDEIETEFFSRVDSANLALVALEYQAIDLVNEGNTNKAIQILESEKYWNQKKIYEQALRDYVTKRGVAYNEALVASTDTLNTVSEVTRSLIQDTTDKITFFLPVIVASSIGISYLLFRSIMKPTKNLTDVSQEIAKGNWDQKAKVFGNDEFGILAKTFNSMLDSLKKSERVRHDALKKFKDMYENSPLLNRTINLDGKITDCNKSYAKAFGYRKEEIVGKSIFDFVAKEDINDNKDAFEQWKKTGKVKSREIVFKRKDGSLFPGILSATNLYDDLGNLLGSNTIIQNLSLIRNAQKEIQELRTKRLSVIGELTSRIAHDMRNPLSTIKNSVELIKMEQKNMSKKTLDKWTRLERGIYRINHQVDDVLDYVRKPIIKKQDTRFSLILQDALERCDIPDNIKINLPKNNGIVFCDHERLEVVLVNLIINASQALNLQKGIINISFLENYENRYSLIKISDNGSGIPSELIKKIFDPLFTTRQIGTGLGLPSCKNIIEYHGGTIDVDSTKGKGTTFTIKLPTKTEWEQISKIGDKEKLTDFITSLGANL